MITYYTTAFWYCIGAAFLLFYITYLWSQFIVINVLYPQPISYYWFPCPLPNHLHFCGNTHNLASFLMPHQTLYNKHDMSIYRKVLGHEKCMNTLNIRSSLFFSNKIKLAVSVHHSSILWIFIQILFLHLLHHHNHHHNCWISWVNYNLPGKKVCTSRLSVRKEIRGVTYSCLWLVLAPTEMILPVVT